NLTNNITAACGSVGKDEVIPSYLSSYRLFIDTINSLLDDTDFYKNEFSYYDDATAKKIYYNQLVDCVKNKYHVEDIIQMVPYQTTIIVKNSENQKCDRYTLHSNTLWTCNNIQKAHIDILWNFCLDNDM